MDSREKIAPAAITGVGMVSSLGHDFKTCCAAARAGITRPEELHYYRYYDPDNIEGQGVIGHPVAFLTAGFEGYARLLPIFAAAISDLSGSVSVKELTKIENIGLYISFPDPNRLYSGSDLIVDVDTRLKFEEEKEVSNSSDFRLEEALPIVQRGLSLSNLSYELPLRAISTSGHTGVAEVIQRAVKHLSDGYIQAAIVGGLDSLLGESTLAWLDATGRLKSDAIPTGLEPGEAGAFIVLERYENAVKRGATILGLLHAVQIAEESKTFFSGQIPVGVALSGVVYDALAEAKHNSVHSKPWVISDQNGETFRALEWGNAVVRLAEPTKGLFEPVMWYPTESFGDTGAASGALSICLGVRAFARGYAASKTAIVISSSDNTLRTSLLLSAAN